ncbi:MAG: tetratricopeptide repeat protein, partial [Caulobacteraceae bacterium]
MSLAGVSADDLARAGAEALGAGETTRAREIFARLSQVRPSDPGAWMGLAMAARALADPAAMLEALDRTLAFEPRHLPALMMKADHFASVGDGRAALSFYQAAERSAPPLQALPPRLRSEVERAGLMRQKYAREFSHHLEEAAAKARAAGSSARFDQAIDLLTGRRTLFLQEPSAFYFPELPQRQ